MPDVAEVAKQIERLFEQIELSAGQKEVEIPDSKRTSWRHAWAVPAMVEFVDSKGSSEPLHITTRTISAQGLDFCSPRMLKPGRKVLITLETDEGELRIPATVIHSRESVGMPTVGVAFDLD